MEDKGNAEELGDDFAGEIIEGGTEASRDDDKFGSIGGVLEDLTIGFQTIGNRGVVEDLDALGCQFATEPLAIGVEFGSGGEFGTDGDDFSEHERGLSCA